MNKPEPQPRDWTYCSKCDRPYGFVNCRVTLNNPHRNICLSCGVEEERCARIKKLSANHNTMDDDKKVEESAPETTETPAEAPAEDAPADEAAAE